MNHKEWWNRKSFIYIGRMSKDKGVVTILDAWIFLYQKHKILAPLWLIGGNTFEIEEIRKYVKNQRMLQEAEKKGFIIWWGYQNSSGISAILTKGLVLLMHSKYEPGGRVVIEAMSSGLPIIGTPYGFAKDLIKDWENGFLVEYSDFEKLYRRMEHFISQPLLNLVLGQNAKETVINKLEEWDFLNTHFNVYQSAIENKEYNTNIKNKSIIKNYFLKKELGSCYTYNSIQPTINNIVEFIYSSSINNIDSIKELHIKSTSKLWEIKTKNNSYLVKWPYTKFNNKPLWNKLFADKLVIQSNNRYHIQIQASKIEGFIPLVHSDDNFNLLLYNHYHTIDFNNNYEIFYKVNQLLEKMHKSIVLDSNFIQEFDKKDFSNNDINFVIRQKNVLIEYFKTLNYTLDLNGIYSLRIAWLETEYLLANCEYLRKYFFENNLIEISIFKEFSKLEINYPTTITHGNVNIENIVMKDNDIYFIDGEHIHFAKYGNDIAIFILYAKEDCLTIKDEMNYLKNALISLRLTTNKYKIIISWLAMHTLRDIILNTYLINQNRLNFFLRRFKALTKLRKDNDIIM